MSVISLGLKHGGPFHWAEPVNGWSIGPNHGPPVHCLNYAYFHKACLFVRENSVFPICYPPTDFPNSQVYPSILNAGIWWVPKVKRRLGFLNSSNWTRNSESFIDNNWYSCQKFLQTKSPLSIQFPRFKILSLENHIFNLATFVDM